MVKRVLDELAKQFEARKASMGKDLFSDYKTHWSPFTEQLRTTRNEAGHPVSVAPVSPDRAHAGFLVFPEMVRMATRLLDWIPTGFP